MTYGAGHSVLITGGLGFLGAWLGHRFLREGFVVTAVDRAQVAGSPAEKLGVTRHPRFSLVHSDVTDSRSFANLATDYTIIVHAAAILGVEHVTRRSIQTVDVNVRGTQACLEFAARQRALRRCLLLSTSEVYGPMAGGVTETSAIIVHTDSMRWSYAASKAVGEFLGLAYYRERGVPVTIVRPFNVYGPFRSSSNALTTFVERAVGGEDLELTGDGTQRRSWCYVSDLVEGVRRCVDEPGAVGEIFNLGNDNATISIRELAERVVALAGSASRIRAVGDDEPDVLDRSPVLDKARLTFGFEPVIDLDTGIKRVLESVRAEGQHARSTLDSVS